MSGLAQTLRSQPGRESKKSVGRRQPMAPHEALSQGWPGLASGQFEANARAPSSPGAAVLSYSCVYRFPVLQVLALLQQQGLAIAMPCPTFACSSTTNTGAIKLWRPLVRSTVVRPPSAPADLGAATAEQAHPPAARPSPTAAPPRRRRCDIALLRRSTAQFARRPRESAFRPRRRPR